MTGKTKYAAMDIYESNDESVGYLYGSNQVAFIYTAPWNRSKDERSFDDNELIGLAKEFLNDVYPEGWNEGLTESIAPGLNDGEYTVTFSRNAYGYRLFDNVSVEIQRNGFVFSYNGRRFGCLEVFEKAYSEEEIEAAKNSIIEMIHTYELDVIQFSEPQIEANPAGEVFVTITVKAREITESGSVLTTVDSISTPIRVPEK